MDRPSIAPTLREADRLRLGDFALRLLQPADVPAVLALRNEVLASLDHPDLYVREDDELGFVRGHVAGHPECAGETIGMFDGDELIAYAMLGLPAAEGSDNLGRRIPLGSRAPSQVAHLASCMVRQRYRGHALQRTLLAARFSLAQAHGRPVCVAMVSLHNHASRRNLMRAGLRILHVGDLDGLQRQLVAVDLGKRWQYQPGQARLVGCDDYAGQCELTQAGWWGVSEIVGSGAGMLVFAQAVV
jgi:hypothetical protein